MTYLSALLMSRKRWPFHIDAWVALPDHLHCIWTLPEGDDDNSNRWRVIKQTFSRALPMIQHRSVVRVVRGERGIWQRRFWEHMIVDGADYAAQYGYCLLRPMYCNLSGWVERGIDSPFTRLTINTEPNTTDTWPLPAPGASAILKYKAIYLLHDEQVGQWSDVLSISVGG